MSFYIEKSTKACGECQHFTTRSDVVPCILCSRLMAAFPDRFERALPDGLVYCNECENYEGVRGNEGDATCSLYGLDRTWNEFCSRGKRKENDDDTGREDC